jgi:hypothetical protein
VGQAFFPLDKRLKLGSYQQATRKLERIVCEVGIRLPYEQTAEVLNELLGITIAGRQVERIVDRQGQRAVAIRDAEIEAAWDALEPIGRQPAGPAVLYIEGDGAWVNSREQAHSEGKVGIVHQGPEQVGRQRMRLREAVYVTTFQSFERLGEELYLEADRQGLERAGKVIFLSDGAIGLREIHQTHFHDARYVLDWFHLRRELRQALLVASTELSKDYLIAKYVTLKDLLWFGEVDLVLERLDRLRGMLAGAHARDAITRLKGYIQNNRDGIGYIDLFEQAIHIGSGPIEKAADLIINRRCELRGMSWYRQTANGVCNLRALRFNGDSRWNAFWNA